MLRRFVGVSKYGSYLRTSVSASYSKLSDVPKPNGVIKNHKVPPNPFGSIKNQKVPPKPYGHKMKPLPSSPHVAKTINETQENSGSTSCEEKKDNGSDSHKEKKEKNDNLLFWGSLLIIWLFT